jgi:acyl transferase domain-containing protein
LADHAVAGTVLFPGTGLVELAVRAGDEVGCPHLRELTLQAPLTIADGGVVQVQVAVTGPDGEGERQLRVYSRSGEDGEWTQHAAGVLTADAPAATAIDPQWPPAGAEPVDLTGFYPALADAGYHYGPAFQGLTAAWRRGDDVYAEVQLPEPAREDAGRYGIHPALLDAALHACGLLSGDADQTIQLPFAWTAVTLHAAGAAALRVRLAAAGPESVTVSATDGAGRPVLTAESLALRALDAAAIGAPLDDLYHLDWFAVPAGDVVVPPAAAWATVGDDPFGVSAALQYAGLAVADHADPDALTALLDTGAPAPELVFLSCRPSASAGAEAVHGTALAVLDFLQRWLADERLATARLVVVTAGAVAAGGPGTDLASAAVRTSSGYSSGGSSDSTIVPGPDSAAKCSFCRNPSRWPISVRWASTRSMPSRPPSVSTDSMASIRRSEPGAACRCRSTSGTIPGCRATATRIRSSSTRTRSGQPPSGNARSTERNTWSTTSSSRACRSAT